MSGSNWNTDAGDAKGAMAGGTVAAYFANGEDAHRAIQELVDEGFDANQIGAALHSSAMAGFSSPFAGRPVNDLPIRPLGGPAASNAGPKSDTSAVFPWGLSTGGGTPFAGSPTRPGPIPGGEIPSTLPHEIPSELPHEIPSELASDSASRVSSRDYAYSGSAFESSFSGMGIPPDHARRLSRELQRGGAVVTMKAGPKAPAAEEILERHHGVIRYESATAAGGEKPRRAENERVQVFGEVHRVYPGQVKSDVAGHVPTEDVRERKAS
ncbi:MAG: hypothetical protein WBD10_03625 [Acidobacteriaceae bacterium]